MIKIENKLALIIGGSGGIGIETAKVLFNKGVKVCLTYYRNAEKIKGILKEYRMEGSRLYRIDMGDEKDIEKGIAAILKEHKRIDAVIHCVSIPVINKKICDLTWQDFQEHIDIQIKGLFTVIRALMPLIDDNYKIKFIVVLTEYCIGKPPTMLSHYITAKYGLMGFVKCMASELITNNCTFNMVSPGMVKTDLLSNLPPKLVEITAYKNPMKRIAEPNDVAKVISFLVLEDSGYLNGVNIMVNGGNIFV